MLDIATDEERKTLVKEIVRRVDITPDGDASITPKRKYLPFFPPEIQNEPEQ